MAMFAELLAKELTVDLEWREEELAVMRKQLYLSDKGSIQEKVLLRANLAMTYAHYEGYCKFALDLYLDSLSKLKLRRSELVWRLAAFSMSSFRSELTASNNSSDFFL